MVKAAYVTFDDINQFTGAGQVCFHELEALKTVTDVTQVITKKEIGNPIDKYYSFSPFTYDYFTSLLLKKNIEFLHLSCSPANAILAKVRPKHFVTNCPAHDLKNSIKEHEVITGTPYPFAHNIDPYLHDILLNHLKEADAVITPSNGSRDWIEDNIKPQRVVVIPHGITLPEKPCPSTEFGNVGYIGAWGPDKGIKYLIEAWSKLDYSDSTLMFFGRESERAEPLLRHWATGGKYHLYGGFENLDEIMPLFSTLIHPSVSEGYGMTVPEAMAYGKVVIVSTGTGSSMHIEQGRTGYLFSPRDVNFLATCIDDLKLNFDDMKSMGIEARKKAESLSWEKVKKMYEKLYLEILS